jgi:hypothetical protein
VTGFLGLNQRNYPDSGCNFLDLYFLNFAVLSFDRAEYGLIQPNHYPAVIIDCTVSIRRSKQNCNVSRKRFPAGDCAVHYAPSNCDWSSRYNDTSADAAVESLNVAVTQTLDLVVPCGHIKKHEYPARFSGMKRKVIFIGGTSSLRPTVSTTDSLLPEISYNRH